MTGAPCAAFRPSQARVLCASAHLPEPRALLLWPGPHRQLRPLRVSPRRAVQAEEPSEQGEGGDDEDQEQEDLAAARRVQNVAINELETAQQAFTVLQNVWLQEFKANGNTEEAKQAEAKKDKGDKKVEKAEEKVKKATQEVEKAKKAASASVQDPESLVQDTFVLVAIFIFDCQVFFAIRLVLPRSLSACK
ncbi:unnamed protein product [Symbiodinium microadriaticum]|nr:unnamed protein product [Symbiodinium microadriaticum]